MDPCEKLCNKDPRNPLFNDLYGYEDEKPIPRSDCACDNCFYGRDAMALEIIRLREALEKLACLGNGNRPGNSIGNSIAQAALAHND